MFKDQEFQQQLYTLLCDHPQGMGEYELLKALREARHPDYGAAIFSDSLSLFRAHFSLFHALYHLRERGIAERHYTLEISPLRIVLRDYREPTTQALAEPDPMCDYYLEGSHLHTTTREQVEKMLGAFWQGFHQRESRRCALDLLGLQDPVDAATIRQHYRRMAMQHHPDRGGDPARFLELRKAMELLKRRK